jgi:hypothetical protein
MAAHVLPTADPQDSPIELEKIVCGIDASPQGVEAVRQAIALAAGVARYSASRLGIQASRFTLVRTPLR